MHGRVYFRILYERRQKSSAKFVEGGNTNPRGSNLIYNLGKISPKRGQKHPLAPPEINSA